MEISHLHMYSDPLLSNLLKHLWQRLQSLLRYAATNLANLYSGSFSHSSLQILSSSVRLDGERCCTAFSRSLQRCLIRALAVSLKDIQRHDPKPLLHCLGCVLRFVVLLEGEPSPPVCGPECSGTGFHQGSLSTLLCSSLP